MAFIDSSPQKHTRTYMCATLDAPSPFQHYFNYLLLLWIQCMKTNRFHFNHAYFSWLNLNKTLCWTRECKTFLLDKLLNHYQNSWYIFCRCTNQLIDKFCFCAGRRKPLQMRQKTCIACACIATPVHRSGACNHTRVHIHTRTCQPANSYAGAKVRLSESWPGLKHPCDLDGWNIGWRSLLLVGWS